MQPTLTRLAAVTLLGALGLSVGAALLMPPAAALLGAGDAVDEPLDLDPLAQRSLVYAADGSLLAVLHDEENRSPVPLAEIPPVVVRIILTIEDEHFYEHSGINLRATARALATNVEAGELLQGGSTVTQQVVKNALLSPEKKLDRKLKEALLAWRLEQEHSKREILERYLNGVYFGNGAYGLQAAAETYFGKDAKDLTAGDAALLAAVIRNLVGYDPLERPGLARERRRLVLGRLVDAGVVRPAAAARIAGSPIPTRRAKVLPKPDSYFVEAVKQQLLDDPRLGETAPERYNAVFRGGLRIHTTLEPRLQDLAEAAVTEQLPDTGGEFTAALVSVEPTTGAVRALVGGPGFERAKFNLVTQARRQPGSSFKPFVLAAALEAGYTTRDTIDGTGPCRIEAPGLAEPWEPENYEGDYGSTTTLEWSTARSLNCAFARLGLIVGADEIAAMARALGVRGHLDEVPAMALGTEEVTPLEMAGAFAAFADDGLFRQPFLVERVVDADGNEVLAGRAEPVRALSRENARMLTATLQTVVESGTGTRAALPGRPVAGKTGTAQEWTNAWFVGFTPQLSTAVWMGAPVGNVPMYSVGGVRVVGGSYPAMIWRAFMYPALLDQPVLDFPEPDWSGVPYGQYLRVEGEYSSYAPYYTPYVTTAPPATEPATEPAPDPAAPTTTAKVKPYDPPPPPTTAEPSPTTAPQENG